MIGQFISQSVLQRSSAPENQQFHEQVNRQSSLEGANCWRDSGFFVAVMDESARPRYVDSRVSTTLGVGRSRYLDCDAFSTICSPIGPRVLFMHLDKPQVRRSSPQKPCRRCFLLLPATPRPSTKSETEPT